MLDSDSEDLAAVVFNVRRCDSFCLGEIARICLNQPLILCTESTASAYWSAWLSLASGGHIQARRARARCSRTPTQSAPLTLSFRLCVTVPALTLLMIA